VTTGVKTKLVILSGAKNPRILLEAPQRHNEAASLCTTAFRGSQEITLPGRPEIMIQIT
jgi:hypothetical protein